MCELMAWGIFDNHAKLDVEKITEFYSVERH